MMERRAIPAGIKAIQPAKYPTTAAAIAQNQQALAFDCAEASKSAAVAVRASTLTMSPPKVRSDASVRGGVARSGTLGLSNRAGGVSLSSRALDYGLNNVIGVSRGEQSVGSATIFSVPFLVMQPLMTCSGSGGVKHASGSRWKGGVNVGRVKV